MEKHSICKCSNTPEARNFTSKGQAHVHCPCEKCEDKAVYPIVAWRHMRKRARYSDDNGDGADLDYADHHVHVATSLQPETSNSSDCVNSVSNYHAEFCTCSSSLMGVPFFEYGNSEKGSLNAKKMASRNIFQHLFCMNFFMFVLLISNFPTVFLVQFGINLH